MAGKKSNGQKSAQKKSEVHMDRVRMKKWLLLIGSMIAIMFLAALLSGKKLPFDAILREVFAEFGLIDDLQTADVEGELVVTFLDVGQADCTILQCGEHAMMIDGGSRGDAAEVIEAAKGLGIGRFDYIVATHSHEDHIGGLPKVIRAFEVDAVVFRDEKNQDSKIYADFKDAVKESGADVIVPKPGVSFEFGEALVEIFAPQEIEYDDTNNYSAALVVTFGKEKFFFTGDAEEESEKQMLELGTLPDVDVFQAGHHGSETSNSEAFLKVVNPAYAVISCGEGNKYGHPHAAVIARFLDMDMQVYRTDMMGTITIKTDGKTLDISTQQKNAE